MNIYFSRNAQKMWVKSVGKNKVRTNENILVQMNEKNVQLN